MNVSLIQWKLENGYKIESELDFRANLAPLNVSFAFEEAVKLDNSTFEV